MRKNFKTSNWEKIGKNKYFAKEDNQIDKNYKNSCSTWSDIINMQIKDTMRSLKKWEIEKIKEMKIPSLTENGGTLIILLRMNIGKIPLEFLVVLKQFLNIRKQYRLLLCNPSILFLDIYIGQVLCMCKEN